MNASALKSILAARALCAENRVSILAARILLFFDVRDFMEACRLMDVGLIEDEKTNLSDPALAWSLEAKVEWGKLSAHCTAEEHAELFPAPSEVAS